MDLIELVDSLLPFSHEESTKKAHEESMSERVAKRARGGDGGAAGSGGAGPAGSGGGATRSTSSKGKVIAVYNYKGGCGKTTTCINTASVMTHKLKKRVLLVDCDPQCNLTSFLYPEPPKLSEVVQEEGEDDEDVSSMELEDDEEDVALPIWAGILPIETKLGAPITAANAAGIAVPSHIAN
jgi:Mrp family chromosome partitioning ATPase